MFLIRTLSALIVLGLVSQKQTAAISDESIPADCTLNEAGIDNSISPSVEICTTPGCTTAASSIQKWMNLSIDPCHDFYEFACGNFGKFESSQLGNKIFDNMKLTEENVTLTLKKNIENDINQDDPKVFHKIKTFYETCSDTAQIEKTSKNNLIEILRELGGWPLLDGSSWNESDFDWKKTMYKLNKIGYPINYFFDISNKFNATNESLTFNLKPTKTYEGLEYEKFMWNLVELFGINRTESKEEVQLMHKFEKDLRRLGIILVAKHIDPLNMKDLQTLYPDLPWSELLFTSVPLEKLKPHIKISFDLEKFFNFMSIIPKRVIANYMMWKVVVRSSLINGPGQDLIFKFDTEWSYDYMILNKGNSRWQICLKIIQDRLPLVSNALYIKRNMDKDNEKIVVSMIGNFKKTLKSLINNVDWMDEKTKIAALEKLEKLSASSFYPSELTNNLILDEYHRNLKIFSNNYLKSYLSISSFNNYLWMDTILKFVTNKSHWIHHGSNELSSMAFYRYKLNTVEIPIAIQRGVYFSKDRPQYLNYGALGNVIGHELFHAFEPKNDGGLNLINWTEASIKEFSHRTQCIINQYKRYSIEEDSENLKVKGFRDQIPWEDLHDIAGIKLAYTSYNSWEKENKMEARLAISPNTNYTSQQMFWISGANLWCSNNVKPFSIYVPGIHSGPKYRVNGAFSNMREFSRDFNCSSKSRMYQPKKHSIW